MKRFSYNNQIIDALLTIAAFFFCFIAEIFSRIGLWIHPDMDVDFNYLSRWRKKD